MSLLTLLQSQGPTPVKVWLNVGGTWKLCTVYLNVAAVWKLSTLRLNVSGTWK